MRKVVLSLLLLAGTTSANAQSRQNAIKINPLSLAVATGNVAYERAVNDKQSFQIRWILFWYQLR
jgi:outer membrane murein-binding lipoprotein Lpp